MPLVARAIVPRWVKSRNCRSERPEDHDRRIEDAGHCHAEEHNQGKDLQGPGGTGAARKLPVCENSCDHGQGKKNQGYQCEKRALHRSRSMAGEGPCSSDRPMPSEEHPVNKTAAEKALTAAGKATSSNPARATSIPYRWGRRPPAEGPDCGRPFT